MFSGQVLLKEGGVVSAKGKNCFIGIHIYVQVSKVTFLVWNKIPETSSDRFPLVLSLVFIYMFINRAFFSDFTYKKTRRYLCSRQPEIFLSGFP